MIVLNLIEPIVPFIMVLLSIVFLMLAKIMRLHVNIAFIVSMLFLAAAWLSGFSRTEFFGVAIDHIAQLALKILLPAVAVVCLMIMRKTLAPSRKIETLLLVLISCLGAMTTLVSQNWMLFFIGLQCMSLPLYGLLAFDPHDNLSLSSSARYLLLSFVAMAIMLFGILLLYAATGTMELAAQSAKIKTLPSTAMSMIGLGLILIIIGLAFKMSLFPFHAWAPEVYRGARLFVVSYLVVIVKSVVVIFLMRCAFSLIGTDNISLNAVITFMALISMWIGNGMMLREQNIIRMLAFLSISHLGALMIPILAHNNFSFMAIFLDVIAFGLAMLLIFAALKSLDQDRQKGITINDLQGLYYARPLESIMLSIALISITGFPLTAGFVGKFAILEAGVEASLWNMIFHFVLSSVLGLFVIAKIIASMFTKTFTPRAKIEERWLSGIIMCAAMAILVMGLFPEPVIAWVKLYTLNV